MIYTTIIAGVEQVVNQLLKLDPEVSKQLFQLKGKVLKLTISDLQVDVFIRVRQDYLRLSAHYEGIVDASMKANSLTLLNSYQKGFSIGGGLDIEGDMEFVETFSGLMQKYRIDWEELISKVVGDIAAHKIHGAISDVFNWGKDAVDRVRLDVSDYVHEEARVVPPRTQLEDFYADIALVRDGVERASARVDRLMQSVEEA